jgi:Heavy-metal resistance
MKKSGVILLLGLAFALAAYCGGYFASTAKPRAMLHSDAPELAWLKEEFNLSDAEFKRISDLHDAYLPGCMERCQRIEAKNKELKAIVAQSGAMTPEVERKLAEAAAIRLECEKAMLSHFLAVSKAMPPEQGKRYLSWIEQQTFMGEERMASHHH